MTVFKIFVYSSPFEVCVIDETVEAKEGQTNIKQIKDDWSTQTLTICCCICADSLSAAVILCFVLGFVYK